MVFEVCTSSTKFHENKQYVPPPFGDGVCVCGCVCVCVCVWGGGGGGGGGDIRHAYQGLCKQYSLIWVHTICSGLFVFGS